jgi:hypothetical protein
MSTVIDPLELVNEFNIKGFIDQYLMDISKKIIASHEECSKTENNSYVFINILGPIINGIIQIGSDNQHFTETMHKYRSLPDINNTPLVTYLSKYVLKYIFIAAKSSIADEGIRDKMAAIEKECFK